MINLFKVENLNQNTKHYLINFSLVWVVLFSIVLMFFVQFKVDGLQDKVSDVDIKISALDDEIRVLEVEWVYLTRPERLRMLSSKYFQSNGYIASNQVKDAKDLQTYYSANLRKVGNFAMNDNDQKLN